MPRPAVRFFVAPILAFTVLAGGGAHAAPEPRESLADGALCAEATSRVEASERLPLHLLRAVSLAESGRWDEARRASFAWPWTVTSGGPGQFFPDKASAIAAVKRLQARGVRNIDVGCMQVNLMHHPDAFEDLEAAFDPARNAMYAAQFLKDLRLERRSWSAAVAYYHSATPDKGNAYSDKVFSLWQNETQRAFKAALAARQALYQAQLAHRRASPAFVSGTAFAAR
jgi:hypothetical protein